MEQKKTARYDTAVNLPQENRADAAVATALGTLQSLSSDALKGIVDKLIGVEHETDRSRPVLTHLPKTRRGSGTGQVGEWTPKHEQHASHNGHHTHEEIIRTI